MRPIIIIPPHLHPHFFTTFPPLNTPNMNTLKTRNITLTLLFIIIFTYLAVRAFTLSITHDESVTFSFLKEDNIYLTTANHHHLNTWLMHCFTGLFGNNVGVLRLPNLLAFALYFWSVVQLTKPLKNLVLFLAALSCFLLQPFLLEFFALARGYGLSIALLTTSLVFVVRLAHNFTDYKSFIKNYWLSSVFGLLAVSANLGMINVYLCLQALIVVQFLLHTYGSLEKKKELRKFVVSILLLLIPLAFCVARLLELKANKQLYYGTNSLREAFDSLVYANSFVTIFKNEFSLILKVALIIVLILATVVLIQQKDLKSPLFQATFLIVSVLALLQFEHLLLNTKLPERRTALFIFPLVGFLITQLLIRAEQLKKIKTVLQTSSFVLILLPLVFNFSKGVNLTHTSTWKYDADAKDIFLKMEEISSQSSDDISISNDWFLEPSLNFYRSTTASTLPEFKKLEIDTTAQFIITAQPELVPENYSSIAKFHISNNIIYQKQSK